MCSVNSAIIAYLKKADITKSLVNDLAKELKVKGDSMIDLETAVASYEATLSIGTINLSTEMEEKFSAYIDLISKRGYFKSHEKGSIEYKSLFTKARIRFMKRFNASYTKDNTVLSEEESIKLGDSHKLRGNEYFRDHNYPDAIAEYSEAIKINPNNALYYTNRALVLQKLNRNDDAIVDSKKAIELDPKCVRAFSRLADSLVNLKQFEDALHVIDEAIDMDDDKIHKIKREEILNKKIITEGGNINTGRANGIPNDGSMPPSMENMPMGPNGMPDFASMMSNPDFLQMSQNMLQNNPELMKYAEQLMKDPNALQQMFANMPGKGVFPDSSEIENSSGREEDQRK